MRVLGSAGYPLQQVCCGVTSKFCDTRVLFSATPSPADLIRVCRLLCERYDSATPGHSFQPHPPQPILYVCVGCCVNNTTPRHPDTSFSHTLPNRFASRLWRLAHPSHALASPPSAACEARATAVGWVDSIMCVRRLSVSAGGRLALALLRRVSGEPTHRTPPRGYASFPLRPFRRSRRPARGQPR